MSKEKKRNKWNWRLGVAHLEATWRRLRSAALEADPFRERGISTCTLSSPPWPPSCLGSRRWLVLRRPASLWGWKPKPSKGNLWICKLRFPFLVFPTAFLWWLGFWKSCSHDLCSCYHWAASWPSRMAMVSIPGGCLDGIVNSWEPAGHKDLQLRKWTQEMHSGIRCNGGLFRYRKTLEFCGCPRTEQLTPLSLQPQSGTSCEVSNQWASHIQEVI